jgi:hypothetical protein
MKVCGSCYCLLRSLRLFLRVVNIHIAYLHRVPYGHWKEFSECVINAILVNIFFNRLHLFLFEYLYVQVNIFCWFNRTVH